MFKFVHIADVHLDSLVLGYENHRQTILDAIVHSFEKSIDTAIDNKCHALIISGDLFDSEHMTYNTELWLRECFAKLLRNNISVMYCLGNHDPATSKIRLEKLGKNVFVFDEKEPVKVEIPDDSGNIVGIVAGVGYDTKHVKENLAKKFIPIKSDVPVVGMLHTSLDKGNDVNYAPCKAEDLESTGYDYWALGHIHEREIITRTSTTIVYPGCISGTHWNETGEKGCMLVEIENNTIPKCAPIILSDIMWHQIDVTGFDDANDAQAIIDICTDAVYDINQNDKINFIRMTISGSCPMASNITEEDIALFENKLEEYNGCKVSLKNKLTTPINPDKYKDDKHLLSIAMEYAEDMKNDPDMVMDIINAAAQDYKTLDGGSGSEYVLSLLDDMDRQLCQSMLNMDKAGEKQ